MRFRELATLSVLVLAFGVPFAHGQAAPTARRPLELSAFGGLTGTWTGLSGGRNLGITAGVDVGLPIFFGFRPYLEGRGNHFIDGGEIDAQKSALGGVGIEKSLRHGLRVYGDILIGRGEIDYQNGGYPSLSGNYLYLSNTTNVFSPGVGLDYRLSDHLSVLVDAQFQHWDTPATPSGAIWSKPITLGARYRFNFNRHGYAIKE